MTEGIEAITTRALGLALDAASLRQQAITTNIANAGVEGFTPLEVDFESQLRSAWQQNGKLRQLDPSALDRAQPRLQQVATQDGLATSQRVRLDEQVAHMAQNGVHYQALAAGLTRHYAILSLAASDGRK